jgi:hypothetical protein
VSRFRKKPVEIEAWRIGSLDEPRPDWLRGNPVVRGNGESYIEIETLEGTMRGNRGDWIIRGVQGELYPCRADIFEQTYEAVE